MYKDILKNAFENREKLQKELEEINIFIKLHEKFDPTVPVLSNSAASEENKLIKKPTLLQDTSLEQANLYFNLLTCFERCKEKHKEKDIFYFFNHAEMLIGGISFLSSRLQEIFSEELYYCKFFKAVMEEIDGKYKYHSDIFENEYEITKILRDYGHTKIYNVSVV